MACTRDEIVKIAQDWIGLKEQDGSYQEILDVYNSCWPRARGYKIKQGVAWCACFVSACAIKAGATDLIPTEVSCGKQIALMQQKGIWVESDAYVPAAGDIIYYDWGDSGSGDNTAWPDHVGIVEKVVGNTIYVIEGNLNDSVARRTIPVNGKTIRGYAVPKYSGSKPAAKPVEKPVEPVNSEVFVKGDKVQLVEGAVYWSGKNPAKWLFKKTLYVRQIDGDRIVVSTLKIGAITGAVHRKYLKKV